MAVDRVCESASLTAVADAIRTKGGTSETLTFPNGFVTAIENIQSGADVHFTTITTSTSSTNQWVTLLSENEYLAQNYNDDKLFAFIFPLTGVNYNGFCINLNFSSNTKLGYYPTYERSIYNICSTHKGSTNVTTTLTSTEQLKTSTTSSGAGRLHVNSAGTLAVKTSSSCVLYSGTYLVCYGKLP